MTESPCIDIDLVIKGGRILTLDRDFTEFNPGIICIAGNRIEFIGQEAEIPLKFRIKSTIDASGMLITPPFFNCHNHAAMSIFRGLGNDLSLDDWLNLFIWPAERKYINRETVYLGTMISAMEMVRSGTGIFADMYFFEEEVARAAEEIGMRVILGEGILDFPTPNKQDPFEILEHTRYLHQRFAGHSLVSVSVSAHAPYTCSPRVIAYAAELSAELGIPANIHLSETRSEIEIMMDRYGKSPVKYLADLGFLGPRTVAHHGIHLSEEDIDLLVESGASVVTIPNSNMKLGSGECRVPELLSRGINVSLGTDGPASNNHQSMVREMQQLARKQKVISLDPLIITSRGCLKIATINGARAYGMEHQLGSLETGKLADLIFINQEQAHWYPKYDPYAGIAYAMHSEDVDSMMIDGRFIMKGRKILNVDEKEIIARAKELPRIINLSGL